MSVNKTPRGLERGGCVRRGILGSKKCLPGEETRGDERRGEETRGEEMRGDQRRNGQKAVEQIEAGYKGKITKNARL